MSASDLLSVRRASDGNLVQTLPAPGVGAFSPDGAFAAVPEEGGRLAIVDLADDATTELQTGTAAALTSAAFVRGSKNLIAWGANGNLQAVTCEFCAAGPALAALARARLARIAHFRPPKAGRAAPRGRVNNGRPQLARSRVRTSSSVDRTVRLWDVRTHTQLGQPRAIHPHFFRD
jgi:hypothetical protein